MIHEAEKEGINTYLFNIEKNPKQFPDNLSGKTLIGVLSPTHGFNPLYSYKSEANCMNV